MAGSPSANAAPWSRVVEGWAYAFLLKPHRAPECRHCLEVAYDYLHPLVSRDRGEKMPNWKDPKAYEKKRDRTGWAWEFMRRNAKYRDDFAKAAKAWKAIPRKKFMYVGPGAIEAERLSRELGAKWGQLGAIADPSCDAVPKFTLSGPTQPDGQQVDDFYYEPDQSGHFIQKPEFATLTFDLRRPLRPQLKRAGSLLQAREKRVKSIKPARSSETTWGLYLRVLDAKEAGVKTSEIIAAIKAYKIIDYYAALDRVSDHLKRARQLRDNPLALIL